MSEEEKKDHIAFVIALNRSMDKYGLDGFSYWGEDVGLRYILDYFERLERQDWGNDYEDLPYMFLCCWAENHHLVEYGSTLRCCWLTQEGKDLLELLRRFFKTPCKLSWDDTERTTEPLDEIMVAVEDELFCKKEAPERKE